MNKNSAVEAIRIGSGLMALGETIRCQVVFSGDAVYFLNKNAQPIDVGLDPVTETLEMAELSDLKLFVIDSALEEAGMSADDLIESQNLKIISIENLTDLIENVNTIFRF